MNPLQNYLDEQSIEAEIITFEKETKTVKDAANVLGVSESQIVKTVLFIDDLNELIAVILPGDKKVDDQALRTFLSLRSLRIATKEEVYQRTGYQVGAVPPLGFEATFILDANIKGEIYAGGGTTNSILRITTDQLISLDNPLICNVTQ